MIEDFLAGGRDKHLVPHLAVAGGCAVSRLSLAELAARCEAEGEEAVARRYLGDSEFAQWQGFRLHKRRLEWLGGRIAAKDAAMRLREAACPERDWRQWQLAVLPSGRPVLAAGVTPLPEISIAHSGGWATAMASGNRCGIDIQQRQETVVRVKARFCSAAEAERLTASLGGLAEVERLTLLWAAKEAIRKALPVTPLPAFMEMECLAVDGAASGPMLFACCFRRPPQGLQLAVGVVLERDCAVALVAVATNHQPGEK
ncbi:MAG: 4'-phosphopantetheinyl transferase superfamily protein [Desulfobulbaceae bacterium]|nr:4'-phosphopantetheinyl transferase superfamily protein [Desulfobulbaceae bacterium]